MRWCTVPWIRSIFKMAMPRLQFSGMIQCTIKGITIWNGHAQPVFASLSRPVEGAVVHWRYCIHNAQIVSTDIRASYQQADGRLTARSLKVSRPRDSSLELSNRSNVWQDHKQQRRRDACQISERYDYCNIQSRGFATSRNFVLLYKSTSTRDNTKSI